MSGKKRCEGPQHWTGIFGDNAGCWATAPEHDKKPFKAKIVYDGKALCWGCFAEVAIWEALNKKGVAWLKLGDGNRHSEASGQNNEEATNDFFQEDIQQALDSHYKQPETEPFVPEGTCVCGHDAGSHAGDFDDDHNYIPSGACDIGHDAQGNRFCSCEKWRPTSTDFVSVMPGAVGKK